MNYKAILLIASTSIFLTCFGGRDSVIVSPHKVPKASRRSRIRKKMWRAVRKALFVQVQDDENLPLLGCLLGRRFFNSVENRHGNTLLHEAAFAGALETVKILTAEIPVTRTNKLGQSAHYYAVEHRDVLRYLLEQGQPSNPSNDGLSLLHFAVLTGSLQAVKNVVEEAHPDLWARDADGFDPYQLAYDRMKCARDSGTGIMPEDGMLGYLLVKQIEQIGKLK